MPRHQPEPPSTECLAALRDLAAILHAKSTRTAQPGVIAVVGAGASLVANLPSGEALKHRIYERLGTVPLAVGARAVFDAELRYTFPSDTLTTVLSRHSLFELAAVVTRFAWGRDLMGDVIDDELARASHRPLAYEIAAHLAKHRCIDHFVILNFDSLLDDAIKEELPEREKLIVSARDVPASMLATDAAKDACYVVHPFGLLKRRPYSVAWEDVAHRFGPDPVDRFLCDQLPRWSGQESEAVHLLLLGYAAAEPSFRRFLESLCRIPGTNQLRRVVVHLIDPRQAPSLELSRAVAELVAEGKLVEIRSIRTDADMAFELLLDLLDQKAKNGKEPVWVPGARHKIIANCFSAAEIADEPKRFRIELLLQAVKSRGFVHLEAFSHVPRLGAYGGQHASEVLHSLIDGNILKPDPWIGEERLSERKEYVPNYMIEAERDGEPEHPREERDRDPGKDRPRRWDIDKVIAALSAVSEHRAPVWESRVADDEACTFDCERVEWRDYMVRRLREIERAPEIEIVADASPVTEWLIGRHGLFLESIRKLSRTTEALLRRALRQARSGNDVLIDGIWSTGEWLFHPNGWAYGLGQDLLKEPRVRFRMVVTAPGGVRGERSKRRDEVVDLVRDHPRLELCALGWWHLNRILTLVRFPASPDDDEAIYMKRRLARSTVSPYGVSGLGTGYLLEVFESYRGRANPYPVDAS